MATSIATVMLVVISFVLSFGLVVNNSEQVEVTGALEPQKNDIYADINGSVSICKCSDRTLLLRNKSQ